METPPKMSVGGHSIRLLTDIFGDISPAYLPVIFFNSLVYLNRMLVQKNSCYTPTIFTCDQYTHHVVMDTFVNANNFRNKHLREWNPRSCHHVLLITSSGIPLSQIFVRVFAFKNKCPSRRGGQIGPSHTS